MSQLALIAAISLNKAIGTNQRLPWHLPHDWAHFKQITLHKPIIMGRKTWQSLKHPYLPQRTNIVVTHNTNLQADGITPAHSLTHALELAQPAPTVMVIGGATLYQQTLDRATHLYLTIVETVVAADTYFPPWPRDIDWEIISERYHPADHNHCHAFRILHLKRNCSAPKITPYPKTTKYK